MLAFTPGSNLTGDFKTEAAARSWLKRINKWIGNLRADLEQDSVPAPGDPATKWLLFQTEDMIMDADGGVSCLLCKRCKNDFSRVQGKKREPAARMPTQARANGMWHGPDVAELMALTYCEAKVINLVRVYVSIKRLFGRRPLGHPTPFE